jgi:NAD(P)-dependent dehydrogenase (short-subunit alcohol dehydrogenase family)
VREANTLAAGFSGRERSTMSDLNGRVVLVTGASKGIGAAVAAALGAAGASVILHYRGDHAGAEAAAAGFPRDRSLLVPADQADPAAMDALWAAAVGWKGKVDAVVLNAAIMLWGGGVEDPIEAWDDNWERQMRVNVLSPTRLMRNAVGHWLETGRGPGHPDGDGVLVTISSWAAQRGVTDPSMIAYAASKAAVKAAAQTVARGYAKRGVLSYVVAPGVVRTRMSEDFAALQGGEDKVTATLQMGEWVPPDDIGHLVAFLASGKARHLTGATLDVNGASYVR